MAFDAEPELYSSRSSDSYSLVTRGRMSSCGHIIQFKAVERIATGPPADLSIRASGAARRLLRSLNGKESVLCYKLVMGLKQAVLRSGCIRVGIPAHMGRGRSVFAAASAPHTTDEAAAFGIPT